MISKASIYNPHIKSAHVQGKPLAFKLDDLFSVLVVVSGYFPKDLQGVFFISRLLEILNILSAFICSVSKTLVRTRFRLMKKNKKVEVYFSYFTTKTYIN